MQTRKEDLDIFDQNLCHFLPLYPAAWLQIPMKSVLKTDQTVYLKSRKLNALGLFSYMSVGWNKH